LEEGDHSTEDKEEIYLEDNYEPHLKKIHISETKYIFLSVK